MFYPLNNKKTIKKALFYIEDSLKSAGFTFTSYIYNILYSSKLGSFLFKVVLVMALSLAIIISSVKLTLAFKPLYYYDINNLNIQQDSKLSVEEIKLNYDYLINYVNSKEYDFKLPTLPSSDNAIFHFKEVKNVFLLLNKILFFSILISILGIIIEVKHKKIYFLKFTSITLLCLPIVLSIPLLINFDKSFTMFHKIVFNNDYWLFSKKTDPVINILPQPFFMHCALLILSIIFLSSAFLAYFYRKKLRLQETYKR